MLRVLVLFFILLVSTSQSTACSIVYFIDSVSGKIYVANNEDYWYDTKGYIQIMPEKRGDNARLWYGWKDFAQGGINAKGLFFDAAVTPKQEIPEGYAGPNGRNFGDDVLAKCGTVDEAIMFLEQEKIAIDAGHMFFGDANGDAVIIEWVAGERKIISIEGNHLIATNFLLSDTSAGNYPCIRYNSIEDRITKLNETKEAVSLNEFGNVISGAVRVPRDVGDGKIGGTLYTSFISISDMKLVIVPKLNNSKTIVLDLNQEFLRSRKKKIKLKD